MYPMPVQSYKFDTGFFYLQKIVHSTCLKKTKIPFFQIFIFFVSLLQIIQCFLIVGEKLS